MHDGHRYRAEDGRFCIDIRVRTARQLFDGRDPAPFRERDLDDHAVAYLVGAVLELPRHAALKVVFWIAEEPRRSSPTSRSSRPFERTFVTRRIS